jgi:hypothetical protein
MGGIDNTGNRLKQMQPGDCIMANKLFALLCRPCVVSFALAVTGWTTAQAAPLGHVILEARIQGTSAWQRNFLGAAPGDVFEYRLLVDLAPVGTSNTQGAITHNITSTANSGFNSLSLQIKQDASSSLQFSFDPPLSDPNSLASFRNGWADGTGASPGTPTPRPGGNGNDLVGIRPVHTPGVFSGVDPEEVMSFNTFRVTRSPAGSFGVLTPSWGTGSGSLRINGAGQVFMTTFSETGPDPVIGFHGLSLGIPEPATIVLAGIGLAAVFMVSRRRRFRRRG